MRVRTSETHPLQIAQVSAGSDYGKIGITFCPGKQDPVAATGAWQRDLNSDLDVIVNWQTHLVLTLMESHELKLLKVAHIGEAVQAKGLQWRHLPIVDFSTPDENFEQKWLAQGHEIRTLLRRGKNVLVHCKGGLGRAGMTAARLLVELGMPPEEAIKQVRQERKGAIETPSQLELVRNTRCLQAKDQLSNS